MTYSNFCMQVTTTRHDILGLTLVAADELSDLHTDETPAQSHLHNLTNSPADPRVLPKKIRSWRLKRLDRNAIALKTAKLKFGFYITGICQTPRKSVSTGFRTPQQLSRDETRLKMIVFLIHTWQNSVFFRHCSSMFAITDFVTSVSICRSRRNLREILNIFLRLYKTYFDGFRSFATCVFNWSFV